jgi:fucose 4-O-acetylase-like acetyltransferase
MPLFFIMSGYCFKEKYLDDAKSFVVRKIKGIYVPFVVFSMACLAFHNVFCHYYIYEPTWLYDWKNYLWETGRIVTRMHNAGGMFGTAWFLKELFWGNLIFYATLRLVNMLNGKWRLKIGKELATVIVLLVLTEVMSGFKLRIPYFCVTSMSVKAAFFIAFGYLWKQRDWQLNKYVVLLGGIISIVAVLMMDNAGYLSIGTVRMTVRLVPAILGTMCVFEVSRWIVDSRKSIVEFIERGLEYVGQHTLSIVMLHMLAFKLVSYVLIRVYHLPIEQLASNDHVMYEYTMSNVGIFCLYVIVGTCLPLVCAWVWNKGVEKVKCVRCKV